MPYAVLEVDWYGSSFLLDGFDDFYQLDIDCKALYRVVVFKQILKVAEDFRTSLVYSYVPDYVRIPVALQSDFHFI